jgi:hypothetical protein
MKNAIWAVGLSLAMGLTVGCGGGVADEASPEQSNLQTREDAIPDCSLGDNYTMYFSDATYTTQIGGRGCYCGGWSSWGKTSYYSQHLYECI